MAIASADFEAEGAKGGRFRRVVDTVRDLLPHGDALPEVTWQQRHKAILILLWAHVVAVPLVGIVNHQPPLHALAESSLIAVAAIIGSMKESTRQVRMIAAVFGLVTSSALLVHFAHGLIEFHFHFFVIVAVVTLYQSWMPFLFALAYVVLHHGIMGAVDPMGVYNHPAAIANPWKWAFVHGVFILGESAALLVTWRMNERSARSAKASYEERLRQEHARNEAQEKYRQIVENSVEGIYEATMAEGLVTANPALARMLGYSSADELLAEDDHGNLILTNPEEGALLLQEIETHDFVVGFEHEVRTRNGEIRYLSNTARAIRDAEGSLVGLQGSLEDVTERRREARQRMRLEEQLRQAQKMEAVGQLAGGIAHDFNNILAVVMNYASFVKDATDPNDPRYEDVNEIVEAGDRGAKLVRQILALSRREVVEATIIDFNSVVNELKGMLERTLGEDVVLDMNLADDLAAVKMDRTQVEQVLLNLAVNARDAMPQGGSLMVETSNEEIDETVAEQHPELAPGHYVSLSVSDTGMGMDEELRRRIFEPFFTTKPVGEGTGLGLAMVYGVVERANGHVYVYSEPSLGTRFRIYIPAASSVAEAKVDGGVPVETPLGSNQVVLLVEDEPAVRSLTARILQRSGYEVVSAGNGDEALVRWEERKGKIDILLTDVIMPRISGKELSDRLLELQPSLGILYMSGYTDAIVASRGMLDEGEVLLQKPFTATALLHKMRDVINEKDKSPAPSPS